MAEAVQLVGSFPPTTMQRGMLALLGESGRPEFGTHLVKLAFLVRPRIDLRRLERAFSRLTSRHDVLRQTFERQADNWLVKVWSAHPGGLAVEDHGDLADDTYRSLIESRAAVPIRPGIDDPFQISVLRFGKRGDVLLMRLEHGVLDGHSMVVMTEELLKLLIGVPLFGTGVPHQAFLAEFCTPAPAVRAANDAYWSDLLFPVLPNPAQGRFGSSAERPRAVFGNDDCRSTQIRLDEGVYKRLPEMLGAPTQTAFALLKAAFALSLIELTGLPGIYFTTNVDRISASLKNFVGSAIAALPVRCDAVAEESVADCAARLSAQLKRSIAHLPSEAAAPELRFDQMVNAQGGVLRHFSCAITDASERTRKSLFASGMAAPSDEPQKMGPLTIERVKLPAQDRSFNGLSLRVSQRLDGTDLALVYHERFYARSDIEMLIERMLARLKVRQMEIVP